MRTELLNTIWKVNENNFPTNGNNEDQIRFLLSYAILAPSAHNTQPWLCRIKKNTLEIFLDQSRALSISDPTHRQSFLSIGAFVANFCMAAECYGFSLNIDWLPEEKTVKPLVRLMLTSTTTLKVSNPEILKAIKDRHLNRFPFKMNTQLSPTIIRKIYLNDEEDIQTFVISDMKDRARIAELIKIGTEFAFSDPKFRAELASYIIPHISDRDDGIPTYTANIRFVSSFFASAIMRRFDVGRSQAREDQHQFEQAPAFLIFCSKTDESLAWLRTGFLFEKVIVQLTKFGIANGINTAPIEAPLLPEILQKILATKFRPQMLVRVGYPIKIPKHAPRRDVSDILMRN